MDDEDIDAWLERIEASAPPETPGGVLSAVEGLERRLAKLEPLETLAMLAGLQTDPVFGANLVRLDMAMRLVRLCANGTVRPTRDKLFRLLNRDLVDCGVSRLEGPPEDFFVVTLATKRGPFRLFQGIWEKAGAFTEDVIDAFGHFPRSPWGAEALDSVHALLTVSDILAFRAETDWYHLAEGVQGGKIDLPNDRKLAALRGRCLISWASLAQVDIFPETLAPFCMDDVAPESFAAALPGESDLERCPLAAFDEGIVVIAPHNISTAIRALLIDLARAHGEPDRLRVEILQAQSERISLSGFTRLHDLPVRSIDGQPVRQTVWRRSAGRPVHFLQLIDGFGDSPATAFGASTPSRDLDAVAATAIASVRDSMREDPDFQRGLSIVFLGGWGRAGGLAMPFDDPDWDIIAIEPADAAAIAILGNGSPMDLWRLNRQLRMIEEQGFELVGVNGWINLFALWRETDWTIIPAHQTDFQPPAIFNYPTDLLLKVRGEAAERSDRRALPLPDGGFETVVRLDRMDFFGSRKPTYVATDRVQRGEMFGAVLGRRPIWLLVPMSSLQDRSFDTYETWKAALHWLEEGMEAFDAAYPGRDRDAVQITLMVEWPLTREGHSVDDRAIDASITVELDRSTRTAVLRLGPAWQHGLQRVDNYAELRLAAELFTIVGTLIDVEVEVAALLGMMRGIVASDDIRWRHSFVVERPLTLLKAHGLLVPFEKIPESASALVRCGSTFLTRPRAAGPDIVGSERCFAFLMEHHDALLERFRQRLRLFDRAALVEAALSRVTSALGEVETWRMSARALRALYGVDLDQQCSLTRRNETNAVIRGGSIVAEVAACEAVSEGGRAVGEADLDELMADAILIFQTAELVPPVRAGFMEPKIEISPTGDLIFDHAFFRSTLVPSVERRHAESRADADDAYRSLFERTDDPVPPPEQFVQAVLAEYAMSFEAFLDVSGACANLAVETGKPVLRLTRSRLVGWLRALPNFEGFNLEAAIDRITLPARAGWDDLPVGTVASDFDFSRFDRHHSLIRRPIIAITTGDDPTLVVSPALIERATLHNLGGGIAGTLQGRFWASREMREFVGGAAERKGLEFNDKVAAFVRSLGPTAFASVTLSDALRHRGTDAVKRLGDIDVLVLSSDGRHVWVIEAKDIRFCRTLNETTSRLSEYRGQTDAKGRRDNLRKHLDRVDYVRSHQDDLVRRYGLSEAPTIHGLVVMDSPQPMAFVPNHGSPDAHFMMLPELSTLNWSPP